MTSPKSLTNLFWIERALKTAKKKRSRRTIESTENNGVAGQTSLGSMGSAAPPFMERYEGLVRRLCLNKGVINNFFSFANARGLSTSGELRADRTEGAKLAAKLTGD